MEKFIINKDTKPGINSTLYKTHKKGNPVRLLTAGNNTAIENLSRFIEQICSPLTAEIPNRIRDTSHLLDIIDDLNNSCIPNDSMLISFDIVNMFPSIDNIKGMEAVKMALYSRLSKVPTADCIMEGLQICLFNNIEIC